MKLSSEIKNVSLIGKHFVCPDKIKAHELKSLLWTAIDLKYLFEKENKTLKQGLLCNKCFYFISRIYHVEDAYVGAAAKLLGATLHTAAKDRWDVQEDIKDFPKFLSIFYDGILCRSKRFSRVKEMSNNSRIPVIGVRNIRHSLIDTLSDMMTLQLYRGRLKGLNVSWAGSACCYISSYLSLATRLGVNITYCCTLGTETLQSPWMHPELINGCDAIVKECKSFAEMFDKTDVIILRTNLQSNFKLGEEDVKNASPGWCILQKYPRKVREIDLKLENKNLIWESTNNKKYVLAALMLRVLRDHEHTIKMPDFDEGEILIK